MISELWRRIAAAWQRLRYPGWAEAAAFGFLFGLVAFTPGCAGSFEEAKLAGRQTVGAAPPDAEHCRGLDREHRNWGAAAVGAGALAGVSGLAVYLGPDDDKARLAIAGAGLGFTALAGFSKFEADGAATSWARDCAAR